MVLNPNAIVHTKNNSASAVSRTDICLQCSQSGPVVEMEVWMSSPTAFAWSWGGDCSPFCPLEVVSGEILCSPSSSVQPGWFFLKCWFKMAWNGKLLPHTWQWKGLFPVCLRIWYSSWSLRVYFFPQIRHTNGVMPMCKRMWRSRLPFWLKDLPQYRHVRRGL